MNLEQIIEIISNHTDPNVTIAAAPLKELQRYQALGTVEELTDYKNAAIQNNK